MPVPSFMTLYCKPDFKVTTPSAFLLVARNALPAALVAAATDNNKAETMILNWQCEEITSAWSVYTTQRTILSRLN